MSENLTFDQLPEAVTMLTKEVSELKNLLLQKQEQKVPELSEKLLTVQEAAEFLNLTVPTIYSKVSKGELPVMKRSKRLYFSSTQLMEYIKKGSRKSNAEIEAEAAGYLSNNKKGLNYGK
jgi:excisionase family DNA binding protein